METKHPQEPVLHRYRDREIRRQDIDAIRSLIESHGSRGRTAIAYALCEHWSWRQLNGGAKFYAAYDLLRYLERQGQITLPPGQKPGRPRRKTQLSAYPTPIYRNPLEGGDLSTLVLRRITQEERLGWKILVDRYHYLGHRTIVGEHILYAAYLEEQVVACLAWASAALRCPDRDRAIGWDDGIRKKRLPWVVNNTRFLIFPWIRVPHLASKILATNLRRLSRDWKDVWGHDLVLAETFVDRERFHGTCYRASNWIHVGESRGRSKRGNRYSHHGRPKAIFLYPLHRHWQQILTHPPQGSSVAGSSKGGK